MKAVIIGCGRVGAGMADTAAPPGRRGGGVAPHPPPASNAPPIS